MIQNPKSFKLIFIRNFLGILFTTLLTVYALFNIITNNYITNEALSEFNRSLSYLEEVHIGGERIVFQMANVPQGVLVSPTNFVQEFWAQWEQIQSIRQLMVHTDGILLDPSTGGILSPQLQPMGEQNAAVLQYLAEYFSQHHANFDHGKMHRITTFDQAYYVMAIHFPLVDLSFLLYTDITSATGFMANINRTLGVVLIASGLLGMFIAILMSNRVQTALLRLSHYAQTIGEGQFNQPLEAPFPYQEFNHLAHSMSHMAQRLALAETHQKHFFQNVSHELRTPLMSIQGYAEGIQAGILSPHEASEIILYEGKKMGSLVNQLLYLSRMDSGLDQLKHLPLELGEFLQSICSRFQVLADQSGVSLNLHLPDAPLPFTTDPQKLEIILDNLLTNGLRHANTQLVLIVSQDPLSHTISFSLTDDGGGISETDLPHLFERFYKGASGHTGLGLAIARDLTHALGGTLTAQNDEKRSSGATFHLNLPSPLS